MSLRRLILLNVVDQNFEAAVYAAMVEIEPETTDFERFSAAFVLPGVDAGIERENQLIVAPEQIVFIDRVAAPFDFRRERFGLDRDVFADRRNDVFDFDLNVLDRLLSGKNARLRFDVFAGDFDRQRLVRNLREESAFRVRHDVDYAVRCLNLDADVRHELKHLREDRSRKRARVLRQSTRNKQQY